MATVLLTKPNDLTENHVLVQPYGTQRRTFGYFYQSIDGDCGDSGHADWDVDEAIERATKFADSKGIAYVVILRAKAVQ